MTHPQMIFHSDGVTRPLLGTLDIAYETLRSHGCTIQAEALAAATHQLRHRETSGPLTWTVLDGRNREWRITAINETTGIAYIAPVPPGKRWPPVSSSPLSRIRAIPANRWRSTKTQTATRIYPCETLEDR